MNVKRSVPERPVSVKSVCLAAIGLLTLTLSCGIKSKQHNAMSVNDPHSFATPDSARVTHLDLSLELNFESKTLNGEALWTLAPGYTGQRLVLDTRDLEILAVTDPKGEALAYELGPVKPHLGQALMIQLPAGTEQVRVVYKTRPGAAALQWLDPEQTAGKKHPFLFTQSQAILARTWIPCQDSPGVRFSYNARVKVPAQLLALMSAENPMEKNATGEYQFVMKQPIPAYLMALSAGDLEFAPVGERCGVYAEPATLKAAAWEFADMPKMLVSAEKLYGAYAWDRYDVLVLPPSFPFGGMENPRLTFATPTILAGDRSLTSLIAHELAHSWSGNLVTNATWNDFWLNEGFTVYFERRIMESVYGPDYAQMLHELGQYDLAQTIKKLGKGHKDTHLKLALEGRDPDDGLSDIAYEKGCLFLMHIESVIGREKMDAFLNGYFTEFAFKSQTTEGFLAYLDQHLTQGDKTLEQAINAKGWIFGPGLPEGHPVTHSARFAAVDTQIHDYLEQGQLSVLKTEQWSSHEWLHFLNHLPWTLDLQKMKALDSQFNLTQTGNSELACVWFQMALRSGYEAAFPALEQFVIQVGRRKLVKPIYDEMVQLPNGKEWARKVYAQARPNYHSVTRGTLDALLGVKASGS